MIVSAVVVPSSPMLLPGNVGRADPIGPIRERAVRLIADTLVSSRAERVVVLTGRASAPRHTLAPLGERIGRHLLSLAGWEQRPVDVCAVPFDAGMTMLADATAAALAPAERALVLVVADGSAKRTDAAPGHFDERAETVDDAILLALDRGRPEALLALDQGLCADLWCTGRAPLQTLALATRDREIAARLIWSGDPYGVLYALAVWDLSVPGA